MTMAFNAVPVTVAGLKFNVVDEGKGAQTVLLLHGFPDSSYLWRNQIPRLVNAGYRVIAPDLRGFGGSDKPQKESLYELRQFLIPDVLGILHALGAGKVHLISHDWGAALGWALAAAKPDVVQSLVAMSVAHPRAFKQPPIIQREKSWYILFFQFRSAEMALPARDWQLFRQWGGNHSEAAQQIADLSRPGALVAALNWYRANAHPERSLADVELPTIQVPTMGVWSAGDLHLVEGPMRDSGEFVAKGLYRYERVDGASHWLMLDRPDYVTDMLLNFLKGQQGS
jgi:pimeloyl-ACP methyl ester carboxylesterase